MCVVIRGIKTSTLWSRRIQAFHLPSVHNKTTLTFGKMAPVRLLKLLFPREHMHKAMCTNKLRRGSCQNDVNKSHFQAFYIRGSRLGFVWT